MRKHCILVSVLILVSFLLGACSETVTESQNDRNSGNEVFLSESSAVETDSSADNSTESTTDIINIISKVGLDEAAAQFAVDMLKLTAQDGKNTMISPLSIILALGMTANGADGTTLAEMEAVLCGGESIENFNTFYKSMAERITHPSKGVLSIANSTWYTDEENVFKVKDSYKQSVSDIFNSEINAADFSDPDTVANINDWVNNKTNGKIDKILDKIPEDTVMYLMNALYFEENWINKYDDYSLNEGVFKTSSKEEVKATFMSGTENYYIKDDNAVGFSKSYEGGEFSFVAILPNEGITVEEYLTSLTGEKLLNLLKNRQNGNGTTQMPKFKAEFDSSLIEPLKELGIKTAFDSKSANFSKMTDNSVFISEVKHKTFIEVNQAGTTAAAVTLVDIALGCVPQYDFDIKLNRPFLYMIIDEQTNLPLFIGIMNNPAE